MSKENKTFDKHENGNDFIADVMHWVAVEDNKPKDCESILGIEMPYEARYACHREGNLYISDETGESVMITHWMYAPEPPCA